MLLWAFPALSSTCLLYTSDKKGRPTKQCSAFIVERTDPGFSVGKAEDKMGIRGSSTCELIFEDCRIPADRMLGVRGRGFQLAMATLDGGRIGIASQALGIAEGALEETVAYVKERKQFGRSISAFQNTQFELAEMKARVEAAKYLVYAAALKKQEAMDGKKVRYSVEAAQAKLIAARTASDVTRRCLQLFGGYGYTRDYPKMCIRDRHGHGSLRTAEGSLRLPHGRTHGQERDRGYHGQRCSVGLSLIHI